MLSNHSLFYLFKEIRFWEMQKDNAEVDQNIILNVCIFYIKEEQFKCVTVQMGTFYIHILHDLSNQWVVLLYRTFA